MEQIIAALLTELLKYGLPGLVIVYLLIRSRQLEADIDALQKQKDEQYEKRILEAVKTVSTLAATTGSQQKLAETIDKMADEIADLKAKRR